MGKVLNIIGYVLVIGLGVFGTLFFYTKNKNQVELNQQLTASNAALQSTIDSYNMRTVYEVIGAQPSGGEIKMEDLREVAIPQSATDAENTVFDPSTIVGCYYKVSVKPGTVLTKDLLMDDNGEHCIYRRDILLDYSPISTIVGDYVDIRTVLPNGEVYVVLSHKRVRDIDQTARILTLDLTEGELQIYESLNVDYATFKQFGMTVLATKYLEPGIDTETVAYYPVTHDAENLVRLNTNIEDPTRLINSNLRDHIDEVLWISALQSNTELANSIAAFHTSTGALILTGQASWVHDHTTDDGRVLSDEEWDEYIKSQGGQSQGYDYSYPTDTTGSFSSDVNAAVDQTSENVDAFVEEEVTQ